MAQYYFIVLDEAPITLHGEQTEPKYDLLLGNPEEASGFVLSSADNVNTLVRRVPKGYPVYRSFLRRTDGREGVEIIRRDFN